jgi:hypothetical protein
MEEGYLPRSRGSHWLIGRYEKERIADIVSAPSLIVYADASSEPRCESSSRNFALSLPRSYVPPDSLMQSGNFCIRIPRKLRNDINLRYASRLYHSHPFSLQSIIHTSMVFWKNALFRNSSNVKPEHALLVLEPFFYVSYLCCTASTSMMRYNSTKRICTKSYGGAI